MLGVLHLMFFGLRIDLLLDQFLRFIVLKVWLINVSNVEVLVLSKRVITLDHR